MQKIIITAFMLIGLVSKGQMLKDFNKQILQQTGFVPCLTTEYNEELRKKNPRMFNEAEMERRIQKWVEAYKRKYADANSSERRSSILYIPVVVHVIHNGEAYGVGRNILREQIWSQIDVLNEDFRKLLGSRGYNNHPAGADCEIQFVLAKRRPDGTGFAPSEEGINRVNGNPLGWPVPHVTYDMFGNPNTTFVNGTIKPATIWDPTQYMNIWLVDMTGGGLGGYAQFPEDMGVAAGAGAYSCNSTASTDGIVVRYDGFGSRDKESTYSATFTLLPGAPYGRITTHEVGHYLGLRHIWGDATCGNDYCDDTPVHQAPNPFCPPHPRSNTCGTADEMVENYMDYTGDECKNIFTNDQKIRMRAVLENSPRRREFINSPALVPPSANFGAVVDIVSPTADICSPTFTPVVAVRNMGTNNLTSTIISYQVDGGTILTFNYTGTITTGSTVNVTMPTITVGVGDHTYRAFVSSSNGVANPASPGQNDVTFSFSYTTAGIFPLVENFEGDIFPPKNWQINQVGGQDCATWAHRTDIIGASGTPTAAAFVNHFFYSPAANQLDELITPVINLTATSGAIDLNFDVAYRRYDATTNERLRVFVSTDCGVTWGATPIYDRAGTVLATGTDLTTDFAPNSATLWRNENVDLSSFAGSSIRLKFVSTNQFGNNIYIDNIRVSDARPRVSFVSASTTITENSSSGTEDCRGYQDINLTLSISSAPSSDVTVTFSLAGTATNTADYRLNSATVTFPAGSATNQNLSVRIYNDQATENPETAVLTLSTSSNATANTAARTHTIIIRDNDAVPVPYNAGATLFSENFDGAFSGWSIFTWVGSVNTWRFGNQIVLSGTRSAYVSESASSGNYNGTDDCDVGLRTPLINATAYPNNPLRLTFNFRCNGEFSGGEYRDYGAVGYFTETSPNVFVVLEGGYISTPYQGVTSTTLRTIQLPDTLKGTRFYIGWRWVNNGSVSNQPAFVIDDVVVTALPVGVNIENATFSAPTTPNQIYLAPNSTVFAYNPSTGNLVARIENPTTHDYGCTQVYIDRAGTGAQQFTTTPTSEYLADKTFRVIPTNNNPTGTYNIRLYYTNAEITGWESATGQSRTSAIINKTSGAISAAGLGDPSTQSSPNSQGTFGSGFWIQGGFSNGFSGFGIGLPPGVLPVQLIDFSATPQAKYILLTWQVANELNIQRYVVEKSYNGKEFFSIGFVQAQNVDNYQLFDFNPQIGSNYYRLRIEDANKVEYSRTISIEWGKNAFVKVYPVPTSDKLKVDVFNLETDMVHFRLINSLGQKVYESQDEIVNTFLQKELDTKALAKGLYVLEVLTSNSKQCFKVLFE